MYKVSISVSTTLGEHRFYTNVKHILTFLRYFQRQFVRVSMFTIYYENVLAQRAEKYLTPLLRLYVTL